VIREEADAKENSAPKSHEVVEYFETRDGWRYAYQMLFLCIPPKSNQTSPISYQMAVHCQIQAVVPHPRELSPTSHPLA
jgi:hypothetical protein